MSVKPLKALLKEAEAFCRTTGKVTTLSQAEELSSDISKFAQELMEVDSISSTDPGFEKVARSLNRAEALMQIQTITKLAEFEKKAREGGYSPSQIGEAVEKIAAKKLRDNLRVLTATSTEVLNGKDTSLETKKVLPREIGQARTEQVSTKSLGYGL